MPNANTDVDQAVEEPKAFLGLTRRIRYKIYAWGALGIVLGAAIWRLAYLEPWRWHKYTDSIAVEKVARDVEPGRSQPECRFSQRMASSTRSSVLGTPSASKARTPSQVAVA